MMGSAHNLSVGQYLLTSPPGQRKDTNHSGGAFGQQMFSPNLNKWQGCVAPMPNQASQFQSPNLGGSPYQKSVQTQGIQQQSQMDGVYPR